MSWFDVFVFVSVILCLVFHCIREEFERSITRRQLLVEQNISPNKRRDCSCKIYMARIRQI